MRLEIPKFQRCCFCVSLRHGIIIFGYLNLTFCALKLYIDLWFLHQDGFKDTLTTQLPFFYRGVYMNTQFWFLGLLLIFDVAFNVLLLLGAHKKIEGYLRVYYYYGLMTTVSILVTYIMTRFIRVYDHHSLLILETSYVFVGVVLEMYLLLLIRSELERRDPPYQLSFVNHLAEVNLCPHTISI